MIGISKAVSDKKRFEVTNVTLEEKSETTEAEINLVEGQIETSLTFHKVNDYAIYKITFKNNDNKEFFIKSINNDNTNPYITYSYEQEQNDSVKSGDTVDILLKLTYNNEVKDLNKRNVQETVKFNFDMEDEEGNKVLSDESVNSRASINILEYAILIVVILAVFIFIVIKNKKARKATIACLVLLTPFIVRAINSSFEITITTNVKLHDKMAMVVEVNGKQEVIAVPYGEAPKVKLPEPEKKGYDFIGWYEESNKKEYDFNNKVAEDVSIKAKYKPIDYTISYDYDGGEATNPITYNIETDSITLTNPTKPGYSFTGWTGSNGKTYQTRVTIDKGSIGDLTFTANYSVREDIKYTVVHKYKNLEGDGYSEEFTEELSGTTGSVVKPAARTVTGFINPTLKTLKISADGLAKLEYVYERKMVTLAYSEDVISNKPAGSYKYGTPVTINAKDKLGYTFNKWNLDTEDLSSYVDADDSNTISVGDVVIIGTDWFYVIAPPENGQVKLLTRLNLMADGRQTETEIGYRFANIAFWVNTTNYIYEPFGDSPYLYVYRSVDGHVLSTTQNYVSNYMNYLNSLGIVNVVDARLMSYEEAIAIGCTNMLDSCPDFVTNQYPFWLGSAYNTTSLFAITSNNSNHTGGRISDRTYDGKYSVRPIIVINESDVLALNNSDTLSTFALEEDINVSPSYRPNKNTPYIILHKLQDVNDTSVYSIYNQINKTGVTGDMIRPAVDTSLSTDYVVPEPQVITIAADGSTVLEYNYNYRFYNITLDPNGGSVNTESLKVHKGQSVSLSIPLLLGSRFLGWYTEPEGGTLVVDQNESFTPTKSQTLYAHWESNSLSHVCTTYAIDTDGDRKLSQGDKVVIGDDVFYCLGKDGNSNRIKLLTKYVLDSNSRQTPEKNNYPTYAFSREKYWVSGYTPSEDYTFIYDNYAYNIYRTISNKDIKENNLKEYINNYRNYIQNTYGIMVYDARTIYDSEVEEMTDGDGHGIDPSHYSTQSFWIGSVSCIDSGGCNDVYYYNQTDSSLTALEYDNQWNAGIRPVIIISEDEVNIPWGSNEDAGTEITIGNDTFYIVGKDYDGNIKLLPKYNLDANYRQSEGNYVNLAFADTNFWSSGATSSSSASEEACFDAYCEKAAGFGYIYRTSDNQDVEDIYLTNYVNNYANYLRSTYSLEVIDARLMSYGEAKILGCSYVKNSCPSYVSNQDYWLGSYMSSKSIWYVSSKNVEYDDNRIYTISVFDYNDASCNVGVRPLIIVPPSAIQNQ